MVRVCSRINGFSLVIFLLCVLGVTGIPALHPSVRQGCPFSTHINCCWCRQERFQCSPGCSVRFNQCPRRTSAEDIFNHLRGNLQAIATGPITISRQGVAYNTSLTTTSRPTAGEIWNTLNYVVKRLHELIQSKPEVFLAVVSVSKYVFGGTECWSAADSCRGLQTEAACQSCVDNCQAMLPVLTASVSTIIQVAVGTTVGFVCHAELAISTVMDLSQPISHLVCKNNVFWIRQRQKVALRPGANVNPEFVQYALP